MKDDKHKKKTVCKINKVQPIIIKPSKVQIISKINIILFVYIIEVLYNKLIYCKFKRYF